MMGSKTWLEVGGGRRGVRHPQGKGSESILDCRNVADCISLLLLRLYTILGSRISIITTTTPCYSDYIMLKAGVDGHVATPAESGLVMMPFSMPLLSILACWEQFRVSKNTVQREPLLSLAYYTTSRNFQPP